MQSNHEAFINLAKRISKYHFNQHGNNWEEYNENSKFYYTIEPEIFEVMKDYGGKTLNIIIYPIILQVYTDDDDELFDQIFLFPIFCVKKKYETDGDCNLFKFFDPTGRIYSDVTDFLQNQSFPPGKIAFPKDFHYDKDIENDDDDDIIIEFAYTDTEDKIDKFELEKKNGWIQLFTTMGVSITSILTLGISLGTIPAFGIILGGSAMLYGDDKKINPLDNDIYKNGSEAVKYFTKYGVLLPKSYKISTATALNDLEIQRNFLIMCGYHIDPNTNDVNCNELFIDINKKYGSSTSGDDANKWQVFSCDEFYSYDVHPKSESFFNANISKRDFLIFVPEIKLPTKIDECLLREIKNNYLIKNFTDLEKNRNFDKIMENIAIRLCTNQLLPKDISRIMNEIFNGNWNCFLFTGYHSYKFTFNGYICMRVDEKFYCLFY